MSGRALAVAVTLATVACAAASRSGTSVPKCPASATTRPGPDWKRVVLQDGFAFSMPAGCTPEPETPDSPHGGDRWRCGDVGIDVAWGMWGSDVAAKAAGDGAQECRTTFGILPAVVSTGGAEPRRAVWYRTGYVHEPLLVAWSTRVEDVPLLDAVTRSGTLVGARGPNR